MRSINREVVSHPSGNLRIAYLVSFGLSSCAALIAVVLALFLLGVLPMPAVEGLGNGGAFLATLGILFFLLSSVAATVLGFVGAALAYIFPDKLPAGRIYKVWWCAGVAVPGCVALLLFGGRELLGIL